MEGKKTKGRQKIEMKRIQNEDDRLITFSKRRSGIYKKASELVTLTGAEVAFVVFSPAGKPFSFAHPSVDSIARRFLGQQPAGPEDCTQHIVEAHRQIRINDLNNHHNQLIQKLDAEKQRTKDLKMKAKGKEVAGWWESPIEELNVEQLHEVEVAYKELYAKLCAKIQEKTSAVAAASTSASLDPAAAQSVSAAAANAGGDPPLLRPPPANPKDQSRWGVPSSYTHTHI